MHNSASSVHLSGMQQVTHTALVPGQYPANSASQSPWWTWVPPLPPWFNNWDMWQKGAFHQLEPVSMLTSNHDPTGYQFTQAATPTSPPSRPPMATFTPLAAQ